MTIFDISPVPYSGNVSARNGFVVGILEEGGSNIDGDVYPDGPLQSGTQSLRRISGQKSSKVRMCLQLYGIVIVK